MKSNYSNTSHQKGLTLIEIMIALVIGSFLMIGAMGLFMSNKRIYTEQEAMGRLQENARFALGLIMDDLRMAGYLGCSDDASALSNSLTGFDLFDFTNPIEGSEGGAAWVPSASTDPVSTFAVGGVTSDAITIRYINPIGPDLSFTSGGSMANESANIPATCSAADCTTVVTDDDALAISDCAGTDLFMVDANATNLNPDADLSRVYTDSAQISQYISNRYYVKNGTSGPSLYRYTILQGTVADQEIIEGVENMQILYGVDNNADLLAENYVNAAGVAGAGGWDSVVSVRVAILVRTIEENANNEVDTNTYNLLGTIVDPTNDQHRRRVYATTVEIRNRT